jgi:hypothetical protein
VAVSGSTVTVTPLDSLRRRLSLAPVGLYLTLDAGELQSVDLEPTTHAVKVRLAPATSVTPSARLRVEQPARAGGVGKYSLSGSFTKERDAVVVPLTSAATEVTLSAN